MADYKAILHQYWKYDTFRGIQEDIINSIGSGRDTLGLMPTGGGKSITFQVPALAQEGLCLVITPLIALMKDQVNHLHSRGIKAAAVYSGMTREEILITLENCIFGDYKFLYVSPERLGTEIFQTKLRRMKISFITVDEAHCISQWGYDFRPAYMQIHQIRELLPHAPILALTATATPKVVKDIQRQLHFKEENVFRMSFERKNLAYIVRKTENKQKELLHILGRTKGSAIVYTRNRMKTKDTALLLQEHGFTAEFYHAGLSNEEKDMRQDKWQRGESRIMVATNAFGMGIDKPDVRIVIHIDMPDSPEAYFQEAGRAGRDGLNAYAVLLYSPYDANVLAKRLTESFPEKSYIRQVYEHLCNRFQIAVGDGFGCTYEFDLSKFCHDFKHRHAHAYNALKILTRCGYINYEDEEEHKSRLIFICKKEELYHLHETPEAEKVMLALLRCYTGLFTDYTYIDETFLGHLIGLTPQQIYEGLLQLNRLRIIKYIPRKKAAYITFTQKRVDTDRLVISKEAYEQRKDCYIEHMQAMTEYATSETRCRSRMLLNYFGESNTRNCQQCDVCLHRHTSGLPTGEFKNISEAILRSLSDGCPHSAGEFALLSEEPEKCRKALSFLVSEEKILIQDGKLILAEKFTQDK